jgi:carbon-monoxide dehydrogenase medium subunit
VIPAEFSYTRAGSVDEALRLLAADDGAKVIAGGQSLLPLMKLRLAAADTLVDIGRLSELKGVSKLEDGRLAVGALTTYAELMDSPAIHYGVLKDALPSIGDVQVRNRGTVGGAVAHADPALGPPGGAARARRGDRAPVGVRDAERRGRRVLRGPVPDRGAPGRAAHPGPAPAGRDDAGSAYVSLEQPASGYALVGVAAVVIVGAGGVVEKAGIGITGVSEHPYRAKEVEDALTGPPRPPTTSRPRRRTPSRAAR